jgi:hypothetical protein
VPLIYEVVMRLAEKDEILERSALVVRHLGVVPVARVRVPDMRDLVIDEWLFLNERDKARLATREIAGTACEIYERGPCGL